MSERSHFSLSSWLAVSALALCAVFGTAAKARAEMQVALDVDYALPVDSIGNDGGGFAIRLGQQVHIPLVALTPEVLFAYHSYSGKGDPATYKGSGGVRLGFGEVFRLGSFLHLGVGHLDLDFRSSDPSFTGFTYDVGAFFDLTILPLLNLGVHGAYNQIAFDDQATFRWLTFGFHGELIF